MIRIAFDIGGTFTDFVLHDATSDVTSTLKIPSTPDHPGRALISGFTEFTENLAKTCKRRSLSHTKKGFLSFVYA